MIKNVVLAIVLVVQLVVWFVVDSPFSTEKPKSAPIAEHKLADLPLDRVTRIEVEAPSGSTLTLSKREDAWVVEDVHGFPATQQKVEGALAEFAGLSRADFRTSKRFLHEDFEVDDKKGQRITLHAGGELLASLVVGKLDFGGGQARGTFIRKADEDHVFVARSQKLGVAFSTEPGNWYSPAMMDLDVMDAQRMTDLRTSCHRIEIEGSVPVKDDAGRPVDPPQYENVRYVYERVDPAEDPESAEPWWRVIEPEDKSDLRLDDLLVKGLVGALLGVRATSIVGPAALPEHGLSDEEAVMKVVSRYREADGRETSRVLVIGAERPREAPVPGTPAMGVSERYARVSHPGDPLAQTFVFTVHSTYHTYFQRDPGTFQRRAPPTPPMQAAPQPLPETPKPAPSPLGGEDEKKQPPATTQPSGNDG